MQNKNTAPESIPVNFSDMGTDKVIPWITSDDYNLEKLPAVKMNASKKGFTVELPGYSIVPFTGKAKN